MRTSVRWLAVLFAVLLVVPAPALGVVQGEPNVTAAIADGTLRAGEDATLTVTLANDADLEQASLTNPSFNQRVTTAHAVAVELGSRGPVRSETGTRLVGSLADGQSVALPFDVSVRDDADPGTYRLPVEVTYTYTPQISETIGATQQETETVTRYVTVRVEASARFRVVDTSTDVRAGESGTVSVTLANVGTAAAHDARFALRSPNPAVSTDAAGGAGAAGTAGTAGTAGAAGATRFVEEWPAGRTATLTYAVRAAADSQPQPYTLELVPTFRDDDGDTVTGSSLYVGVTPATDRRFAVVDVESTAVAEGSGTVGVTLRNDGGRAVTDATVALATSTAALRVDGGESASRFVGTWEAGEERTVAYELVAGEATTGGTYTLHATVSYADGAERVTAPSLPVGVTLAEPARFGVENVESDLYVGERGTVRGTVVNEGDRVVRNAVVTVQARSPHVAVSEATVAVGDIAAGGSAEFAVETDVAPSASAGDRPFALTVAYEDASGTERASDPVTFRQSVGADRKPLAVEAVNATFAPDSSGRLVVRVTNTGDAVREDVTLRIAPQPPFTSVGPEAYIDRLAPGESATVAFELAVDEDAVESSHAVPVNVTSEPEGSDVAALDSYRVPVTVAVESSAPVDTTAAVAAVLLAVALAAAGGYWWYRRRREP